MTDVKDNLEYLLNKYELVENGIPAMGDLRTTRDKFKQAILEEMDRVVAEIVDLDVAADDNLPDKDKILVDMTIKDVKDEQRHRWQEVRERL